MVARVRVDLSDREVFWVDTQGGVLDATGEKQLSLAALDALKAIVERHGCVAEP